MKLLTSLLLLASASLLFTACGDSTLEDPMTTYDGKFDMHVYSNTSLNMFGLPCCDYDGEMAVTNGSVLGILLIPPIITGQVLSVSGNVDEAGAIRGNFAKDGLDTAIYEGKLNGVTGSGTWRDTAECSGTWNIEPK